MQESQPPRGKVSKAPRHKRRNPKRRRFTKFAEPKRVITPPVATATKAPQNMARLGTTDRTISDTVSRQAYAWRALAPSVVPQWSLLKPAGRGRKTAVASLKVLAARKIAEKVTHIQRDHLEAAPQWSVWRPVWNNILLLHNDSPVVFSLFALYFHTEPTFRSHFFTTTPSFYLTPNLVPHAETVLRIKHNRNLKLLSTCVPGLEGSKHRVEVFFRNINISLDLARYVRGLSYRPWVVLNLSPCADAFSLREDVMSLLAFEPLVALDLLGFLQLDDNLLFTLGLGLQNGKWPHLQVLRLSSRRGGPLTLTSEGIGRFLAAMARLPALNLCCVETDRSVVVDESLGWRLSTNPTLGKVPMTIKLLLLRSQTDPPLSLPDLSRDVILDITVQDVDYPMLGLLLQVLPSLREACQHMEALWERPSSKVLLSYCYVRAALALPPPTRTAPPVVAKPTRPAKRTGNAKAFFGL